MSDDGGTHDPAETIPPAGPDAPLEIGLALFWGIVVELTILGVPVSLGLAAYLGTFVLGCDPGSAHLENCGSAVPYLPMAGLGLAMVSSVIGGVLSAVRPTVRAKHVHWMFFVFSIVVYAVGCVVAWSLATPG